MIIIDMNNLITEPFICDAKCKASKETDLENGMQVVQSKSEFGMDEFIKQIQEAEIQMDQLSGLLINLKALLRDANEESESITKALEIIEVQHSTKLHNEMISSIKLRSAWGKCIDDAGKIAPNVLGKLQVITIDNLFLKQMPGYGKASVRARMNLTNVLTKKLMELMVEFEVISTVDEIREKLVAVKEIEKGLSELHQIYLKTEVLVKDQAKILDNLKNQGTSADERFRFRSRIDAIKRAKSLQKDIKKIHDDAYHIAGGNSSDHNSPLSLEVKEKVTDGNDTKTQFQC